MTMEFSAGDIVLIRFPYSDGKGFKKRPALVLKGFDDGDLLLAVLPAKSMTPPLTFRWKTGLRSVCF